MASADPAENLVGAHYHDLIVESFSRAGFETSSLSQTRSAEKPMTGSNYHDLVDESFRRAGMGTPKPSGACDKADDGTLSATADCK